MNAKAQVNDAYKKKIDPQFLTLIEAEKLAPPLAKRKKCKKKSLGKAEVYFSCIVYTEHPDLVRNKGVNVQSVLATFLTAKATLSQIIEMAKLPEIHFIEYPSQSYPH